MTDLNLLLKSYQGDPLTDRQRTFLSQAMESGFIPRVTGSKFKTIRVTRNSEDYGYINSTVLGKHQIMGLRLQKDDDGCRIGQGRFRDDVIKVWGACAVTGCTKLELLRASHIKPWSDATNAERLDPNNGLLLIPNLDAAFDRGVISFTDDGTIMISKLFADLDLKTLDIRSNLRLCKINDAMRQYLADHREKWRQRH